MLAASLSSQVMAAQPARLSEDRLILDCAVVYLPERRTSHRQVDLTLMSGQIRAVAIDLQPPYTFQVQGSMILTGFDNERIQIDLEALTWVSDFRGRASGSGRCEVAEGPSDR